MDGRTQNQFKIYRLTMSDTGLRVKAKRYARYAAQIIAQNHYEKGCYFAESMGIDAPNTRWQQLSENWQAARQAEAQAYLEGKNLDQYQALRVQWEAKWQPIKARLVDEAWWIRRLIRKQDYAFEKAAIHKGRVRKGKQIYVSDDTLIKMQARQERSLKVMQGLIAVSDEGDEIEMLDILKTSMANPAVKMAELMNRIYGFEEYAQQQGHLGEFYTFTAPSKYHAHSSKYNGSTPREVQQHYFSRMWARIRAKLHDKGLNVYGFRIAEAHKDGCTHWHVLLFMPKDQVVEVSNLLLAYAFQEDGDEKGAYLSRFDWEEIDPKKGSAVAYIIKYISKNIAGLSFDTSDNAVNGANKHQDDLAKRVGAWASVWGIRQFQQIGGSSVSVWRELRRLGDTVQEDATIEAARKAANAGDWCAYLKVQDGINTPLKAQPIQLYCHARIDAHTGEAFSNKYGEVVESIQGIQANNTLVITRLKQWTFQEKSETGEAEKALPDAIIETHQEALQRLLGGEGERITAACMDIPEGNTGAALAFDLPWSSVNNCRNTQISSPYKDVEFIKAVKKFYQDHAVLYKKASINQETFIKTFLKML